MNKAIILIDYINDICDKNGKIPSCAESVAKNNIIEKINHTLKQLRKNNWLIIWIKVGFDKNYLEANLNSPIFNRVKNLGALIKNTWGTELLNHLDYYENELIIYKNAVNPFHTTNLDHVLRSNQVSELYLAGVSTEVAIQSCTRDAHDRGYKVHVIEDLCTSGNSENHNASIKMLGYIASIVSSDQLI